MLSILKMFKFLKRYFNPINNCERCINRNCVSNNSVCYQCDGEKYFEDEEIWREEGRIIDD